MDITLSSHAIQKLTEYGLNQDMVLSKVKARDGIYHICYLSPDVAAQVQHKENYHGIANRVIAVCRQGTITTVLLRRRTQNLNALKHYLL